MKKRLVRRLALVACAAAAPLALFSLGFGSAGAAVSLMPTNPPPPPPDKVVIVVYDTVAFEKGHFCQPRRPVIELSEAVNVPVTVIFNTSDGTATAPEDYTAIRGLKVTIPAGSRRTTVPVEIKADDVKEPDEYLKVTISSPSAGTIAKDSAVIIIKDGEQPPDGGTPAPTPTPCGQ
jgi:chitinase